MKKTIFALLAIVLLNKGTAQNCSYEKNEVDEFTDKTIKLTNPITFVNISEKMKCSLGRIDLSRFFVVELTTGKALYKIEKENLLYLIFDNGDKAQLEPVELITFSNKIQGYNNIKVAYDLKDADKLKNAAIKKMRITTSDGFFEYEIKKETAKNLFIEQLTCIE